MNIGSWHLFMSRYSQAIAFFPPRRVLSGDNMSKTLLAALLSVCAVAANAQDTSVIRYGVDPTFAPYESVNAQGKMVGIDIELGDAIRSEEHTSELQSLMRISYAVFCLKKKIE